jgi:hypothetical protein
MSTPKLSNVTRHAGVAGQIEISADVTYEYGPSETLRFVGSVYGGPVVMVTPSGVQHFVTEPDRFGSFGTEWVRRFFA